MSSRIPSGTYRLQLHRDFKFKDAMALVGYLHDLGISDCYLSPITEARPGSIHGYDVIDHGVLNPELGSEDDFEKFAQMLRTRGMGIVQDIVPNHMSIGDPANQWWNDVLENGPSSPYADFFDVDWNPPKHDLANKILLPVLGEQYGKVLENKEIQIAYDNGSGTFRARYFDHSFPLAPRSLQWILKPALLLRCSSRSSVNPIPMCWSWKAFSMRSSTCRSAPIRIRKRFASDAVRSPSSGAEFPIYTRKSVEVRDAIEDSQENLNGVMGEPPQLRSVGKSARRPGLPVELLGKSPPMRSTIGGFSISTSWPPFAWRIARCSTPPTKWSSS